MTERTTNIKMLRMEQVEEKVGYKKSTIFEWLRPSSTHYKPHFPIPRKNGRSNRWFESEIDDFCIIEFGCVNNCQRTDSAVTTSKHSVVTAATVQNQPNAIEIGEKSVSPSGKLDLAKTNRPQKPAPIEEDREVSNIRAAEISRGKNVAAHSTGQPFSSADERVANQVQHMPLSDENAVINLVTEIAAAKPADIPVDAGGGKKTVEPTDTVLKKRVIQVSVKKWRTFVAKS